MRLSSIKGQDPVKTQVELEAHFRQTYVQRACEIHKDEKTCRVSQIAADQALSDCQT